MKQRLKAVVAVVAALCMACALCACEEEAYQPTLKDSTVAPEALIEPGKLIVGVDASSYPFAGESGGRISGLNVDVAAALADELGLRLELVDTGMSGLAALGEQVDILMGVDATDAPEGSCWISQPYLAAGIALFAGGEGASAPVAKDKPVIGAQSQSLSAWLVTDLYGADALSASDDLRAIFQDLKDGALEYAASDMAVGHYLCNGLSMEAAMVGLLEESSNYCVAVPADNAALQQAVGEALATVEGTGILEVILTRWVGGSFDASGLSLVPPAQEAADEARKKQEEAARAEAEAEAQAEAGVEGEVAVEADGWAFSEEAPFEEPVEEPQEALEVGANAVTAG